MEKLTTGARRLGIHLTPRQIAQFERYYLELTAWNRRVNLTAIVERGEVETRHLLDSLTVALALPRRQGVRAIDVGAGAGFPGLPLKLAFPDITLTLLEATGKKAAFLANLVSVLGVADVVVVAQRAEDAAHDPLHREAYDVAVARALAAMPVLAELTLPFCRVGGIVVAQKKGDIDDEIEAATFAIDSLGGSVRECIPVHIPEVAEDRRSLVVVEKVRPTPPQYPRRAGMPQKRPLAHRR